MTTAFSPAPRGLGNDAVRHGRIAQVFHWGIAVLIIAAVALGLSLETCPRGTGTYDQVITIHKSIGITMLLLAVGRVWWLLLSPAPTPADRLATWERQLAKAVHKLRHFLMFAMLTGILLSQAVGKPISWWGIGPLPIFVPFDPAVPALKSPWVIGAGLFQTTVFKVALVAALALHVVGTLKHVLVDRDASIFRRMWGR